MINFFLGRDVERFWSFDKLRTGVQRNAVSRETGLQTLKCLEPKLYLDTRRKIQDVRHTRA
jgi:hypothetical protein